MNEQVEKYVKPIKQFWDKQSKKKRITMISVLVGVLLVAIVTVLILNMKTYAILYSGITQEEATEVIQKLSTDGVDYKSQNGGTTILVDKNQEELVRMKLATEGYPRTAPNYDFFKNSVDFMSTESEKRTMKIYQLQERLQATIKTIDGVKQAIVTINSPEDNGWAWEDDKESASASVKLTLKDGVELTASQVNGIKRLVSTSVPGMKNEQVAVVDSTGNELQSSGDKTYVDIANFKLEIEKQYEKNIHNNILQVLTPVVGKQNVSVAVKANMTLDKKIKEIITYTPSGDDGKGVVSESEKNKEAVQGGQNAGGIAGAENNTEVPNYSGVTVNENTISFKDYENYKYLVNKITEQINGESPEVKDLTVGVTVNSKQKLLSAEEKESLTQLIANASGVSPAKVTIFNTDFSAINKDPLSPSQGENILQNKVLIISMTAGTFLLIIGLIIVLIISKRMKKRRLAKAKAAAEAALGEQINPYIPPMPTEPMPNLFEDLKKVPESKEQVLKKEIQDFSGQNPEIVAQLLRTWLKGDEA